MGRLQQNVTQSPPSLAAPFPSVSNCVAELALGCCRSVFGMLENDMTAGFGHRGP